MSLKDKVKTMWYEDGAATGIDGIEWYKVLAAKKELLPALKSRIRGYFAVTKEPTAEGVIEQINDIPDGVFGE